MIPVDQTILHEPESGRYGDCFRCCIASILELPVQDVPHVCNYDHDAAPDKTIWYRDIQRWLRSRGLAYLEMQVTDEYAGPNWFGPITECGFDSHHILTGRSPRGTHHAVVARNGVIVHDPHPSRAGLSGPGDDGWLFGFLLVAGR